MNKKLKKALYMFGFALPIVAIPIITVACGTQTSQNAPKETDKNQNEQTPKQEVPIQDENKKVIVLSSLSSSPIKNILSDDINQLLETNKENGNFKKENKDNEVKTLYKKIFESSITDTQNNENIIVDKPYNIFIPSILNLKLNVFFNIENLKTNIQNLEDSSKLENIKISDILNSNANAVFEYLRLNNNNAASDLKITTTNSDNSEKIIEKAFKEKALEIYNKIKDDLNNDLTKPESIKSLLEKLTFLDLFDVDKLQEKLN